MDNHDMLMSCFALQRHGTTHESCYNFGSGQSTHLVHANRNHFGVRIERNQNVCDYLAVHRHPDEPAHDQLHVCEEKYHLYHHQRYLANGWFTQ